MIEELLGYRNKVCVVTGASSGMGQEVTKLLVELGADVYALDLHPCSVEGITRFIPVNLSDRAAIDEAFRQIPDTIDRFFGVAGLSGLKTPYEVTFNCDYTANWYMTEAYLRKRMQKGAAILYVSSTAGLNWPKFRKEEEKILKASSWEEIQTVIKRPASKSPSTFAYIYAKRCISYYAAKLSTELGPKGIRVNTVLPGSTNTGMKKEFQTMIGGEDKLVKEAGAAGRLASSLEMAWPMIFVNSAGASFVSGLEMNVDYADTEMKKLHLKKDVENIPVTDPLILKIASGTMRKKH